MSYQADDYSKKQAAKDAAYTREYQAWLASLSAEERRQVAELGLDTPMPPRDGCGWLDRDAADTPLASQGPAPIAEEEPAKSPGPDIAAEEVWDILRRLIGELLADRNARLSLECLALVSGMSFLGDSMVSIARRHGVTRAAVSKRCVELTERLNLLPSRAMRSLTARKAYRAAQLNTRLNYERFGHDYT